MKAWFGQGKLDKQKLAEYGLGAFAGVVRLKAALQLT